jgi:copper chaperone
METLRFKTNLKCGGCVNAITPGLKNIESIENWAVDLADPDKVLEISAQEDISETVMDSVKKAGYQISRL